MAVLRDILRVTVAVLAIFDILFIIAGWMGTALILGIVCSVMYFSFVHGRKGNNKPAFPRYTKMITFLFIIGTVWNIQMYTPKYFLPQLITAIDKASLIEPEHPYIEALDKYFRTWVAEGHNLTNCEAYLLYYRNGSLIPFQYEDARYICRDIYLSSQNFDDLEFIEKLMVINYFIQNVVMEYSYDENTYGVSEYKAHIGEILKEAVESNWTVKAKDDCDGSAVVTVSYLQYLGFNAYIGSGKSHWFTVVEPGATDDFNYTVFLNTWKSIHVWYYFNQYSVKLGQPVLQTIVDVWLIDEDEDGSISSYLSFITNNPLLIIILSFFGAMIIVPIIVYPRSYPKGIRDNFKNLRLERRKKISGRKEGDEGRKLPGPIKLLTIPFRYIYILIGNPFKKEHLYYWIDVIWITVYLSTAMLLCPVLIGNNIAYINNYIAIWAFIGLFILDKEYISRLYTNLIKMIRKRG